MSIQERGKGGENGEVGSEQTLETLFLTARFLWKEPLTSSPMQEGRESLGQRGTGIRWVLATRQTKQHLSRLKVRQQHREEEEDKRRDGEELTFIEHLL